MAVTIKDVAKLANVAPSTVSRVIANNPRISEKTKRKVRKAMSELGYHPNFIARSLASKSSDVLGIIMPKSGDGSFLNPFFPTVMKGLSQAAHDDRLGLQITTGITEEEIYGEVEKMVHGGRVDGLILLYSKVGDKVLNYLRKANFPFVVIGKPYQYESSITHVDNDNFQAGKDVAQYLLDCGHTDIAFIGGNADLVVTIERVKGYEAALKEAGIPMRKEYAIHEDFMLEGGKEAVKRLMNLENSPTALIVADDFMSLGVLNMLDELGIDVPGDISVFSFNNVLLAQLSKPPLSSVDINIESLGYQAVKLLLTRIKEPDSPAMRMIVPYQLVLRSSVAEINGGRNQ